MPQCGKSTEKRALGPRKSCQNRQDTAFRVASRKNSEGYKGKSLAKALEFPDGKWRRQTPLSERADGERRESDSFITCVFGIVLRSADSTTRPRYFLRVSEFFSDSDKILVGEALRAPRAGKTGQCGVRPRGGNILVPLGSENSVSVFPFFGT